MASHRVLLVEDDLAVRHAVTTGLRLHGFDVTSTATAEAAIEELRADPPDIVVLDVGLPGMSGLDLCRHVHDRGVAVPILMLSARDAVGDRVAGLHAGADDYLVKPFDLDELVARLGALMRRASARTPAPRTVSVGSLRLDLDRRVAHVDGTAVDLTRREFDLLVALAEHRHVVLSRVQLLELVWGYDFDVETNVVDVFVGYVRRKLGAIAGAPTIRTVRGVGFVLESD